MFDLLISLSLSLVFLIRHDLDVLRALLLWLDLMMFLPHYSLVMDLVFPLKLSYRIESLRI